MSLIPLHIIAGAVALLSGGVALFALKGGKLHRKSGIIFVSAMLVMSAIGGVTATMKHYRLNGQLLNPQWSSVIAGALTFYLVLTGFLTVRRRAEGSHWINASAMFIALTVAAFSFKFGLQALNSPGGKLDGQPGVLGFLFGTVALLAAIGDIRLLLAGGIQGSHRIARHLWRMCFAMWIATSSFFLGQARLFPKPLRVMPLLAAPVLLVLLLMFYWLVRVSFSKRYSGAA
jgi:uncharacterized membrane protein